jgi:ADP-ribose pyrophosphatase YjhB (NUDIX family)
MVGGGVYRGETLAEAVGRQLRETLGPGVSWEDPDYKRPDAIGEFFPDGRPGYGHDPRKHAIAPTWLVAIEGELVPDGDEAKALRWFPRDALPPDDEIGFGHAETIHRVLASAAS